MKKIEEAVFFKEFKAKEAANLARINRMVKELGVTHDDILKMLAVSWVAVEELTESNKEFVSLLKEQEMAMHVFSEGIKSSSEGGRIAVLELLAEVKNVTARALLKGIELQKKTHASHSGKAGAAKRHAPMAELRSWAIEKYRAGKWPSANQAANDLQECVIEHGRTIGANLSKANAQRTIAEWFRKSV